MERITTSDRVIDKHGPGKDGFSDGDPMVEQDGTSLDAGWFDRSQEELARQVEYWGWTLTANSNHQLQRAMGSGLLGVLEAIGDEFGTRFEDLVFEVADLNAVITNPGVFIANGRYVELTTEYLTEYGLFPYVWTDEMDHWVWVNTLTWDVIINVTTFDNPEVPPVGFDEFMRVRVSGGLVTLQDFAPLTTEIDKGLQVSRVWRFGRGIYAHGVGGEAAVDATGEDASSDGVIGRGGDVADGIVGVGGGSTGVGVRATEGADVTARENFFALTLRAFGSGLVAFLPDATDGAIITSLPLNNPGPLGQVGHKVTSPAGSPLATVGFQAFMGGDGIAADLRSETGYPLAIADPLNRAHIHFDEAASTPTLQAAGDVAMISGPIEPTLAVSNGFSWRYAWTGRGRLVTDYDLNQGVIESNSSVYFPIASAVVSEMVVGARMLITVGTSYGSLNPGCDLYFAIRINGGIVFEAERHEGNLTGSNTNDLMADEYSFTFVTSVAVPVNTVEFLVRRDPLSGVAVMYFRDRYVNIVGGL